AEAMGADFAYIGSAFIPTDEARAVEGYKAMITQAGAEDIVYTNLITGVHGNYLKPSIRAAGMDPDNLATSDASAMDFGSGRTKKWKDIWGSGQGIGAVKQVLPVAALVDRLAGEYDQARARLGGHSALVNPAWGRRVPAAG
ncbi:MAG: nitronate monooxygenase, partial [Rubritepida sp.]|nr:nitronate monooxygenase [Rubritepida sp.]